MSFDEILDLTADIFYFIPGINNNIVLRHGGDDWRTCHV